MTRLRLPNRRVRPLRAQQQRPVDEIAEALGRGKVVARSTRMPVFAGRKGISCCRGWRRGLVP